ncbi:hypothetical protein ACFX11_040109 [Malus domestica]
MAMNLSSFFEGPVLRWKLRSETHQPTTAAEQRFCFYYKSFLQPILFHFSLFVPQYRGNYVAINEGIIVCKFAVGV